MTTNQIQLKSHLSFLPRDSWRDIWSLFINMLLNIIFYQIIKSSHMRLFKFFPEYRKTAKLLSWHFIHRRKLRTESKWNSNFVSDWTRTRDDSDRRQNCVDRVSSLFHLKRFIRLNRLGRTDWLHHLTKSIYSCEFVNSFEFAADGWLAQERCVVNLSLLLTLIGFTVLIKSKVSKRTRRSHTKWNEMPAEMQSHS